MTETAAIIETVKQQLKIQQKTYLHVADALHLTEARIKQMFSTNSLSLERLDVICNTVLGMEIAELIQLMSDQSIAVSELSEAQEKGLVADERLMLVAVLVMNNWSIEEITTHFDMQEVECRKHLQVLEKLKLIKVGPKRVRLLIDQNFGWITNGPIERYFRKHIQSDFLDNDFAEPGEKRVFRTGNLSERSCAELCRRIDRLIADFAECHREDSQLELPHRRGYSLIVAMRPWLMPAFAEMKRDTQ
jgi:hypothetical protein